MASLHLSAAAGVCFLIIVCTAQLGLALPVGPFDNDEFGDVKDYGETSTVVSNFTKGEQSNGDSSMSSDGTTEAKNSSSATESKPTATATGNDSSGTSANTSTSTTTTTSPQSSPGETDMTQTEAELPNVDEGTNSDPVEKEPTEIRLWWSKSTWMSVVMPVLIGLGTGLFLITMICCFRWACCRRCCRKGNHRGRSLLGSSPNKKTLREDFRQLRQKDRMKLLAESSDDEF